MFISNWLTRKEVKNERIENEEIDKKFEHNEKKENNKQIINDETDEELERGRSKIKLKPKYKISEPNKYELRSRSRHKRNLSETSINSEDVKLYSKLNNDSKLLLSPLPKTPTKKNKFIDIYDERSSSPSPKTPRKLKTPKTPKTPRTPRTPKTPKTPKTPNNLSTPKYLIQALSTSSLNTPELTYSPDSPTSFNKLDRFNSIFEHQPLTPSTPRSNIYSTAVALFSRGSPSKKQSNINNSELSQYNGIIGREKEYKQIEEFIKPKIENHSGGCLYISGSPGTGKSEVLSSIIKDIENNKNLENEINIVKINCMSIMKPKDIYNLIYESINNNSNKNQNNIFNSISDLSPNNYFDKIEKLLVSKKEISNLIILDEIDAIMTKDQEILYRLFEWAFQKDSNFILIGIANALNFTDRLLPQLKSRGLLPETLTFNPYNVDDIQKIIIQRLELLNDTSFDEKNDKNNNVPLISVQAIQLIARKMASNTGDLRKAFDICRKAIELAEEDTRKKLSASLSTTEKNDSNNNNNNKIKIEKNSSNHSSYSSEELLLMTPTKNPKNKNDVTISSIISKYSLNTVPKVTISHVAKVCARAFGQSTIQRLKALNIQQKAVLCSLVSAQKKIGNGGAITIQNLHDFYIQACKRDEMIYLLKPSEFIEVLTVLESTGVINLSKSRRAGYEDWSNKKVSSAVQEINLITAIGDIGILKRFLA